MRLTDIDSGSVQIAGQDVTKLNGKSLQAARRNFQMIFQDPFESIDPRRTVLDTVVESLIIAGIGANPEERKQIGLQALADVGLTPAEQIGNRFAIANGKDSKKNQAYYLYGLSQENIRNTVFPLGEMEKPQVRELARKFGLVVADKPESQEICFIPENDYRLFLEKKNIQFTPGFFKMKDGSIKNIRTFKSELISAYINKQLQVNE
jgi:ABC-type Fe3+/spermidine/putrescine transport system ATPase subunit